MARPRQGSAAGQRSRRIAGAIALLLAGIAVLVGSPASMQAQSVDESSDVAIYRGFVIASDDGVAPTRVRAVMDDGTVCGTGEVTASSLDSGFYEIAVASGWEKDGCPYPGEQFYFRLLAGKINEGAVAREPATYSFGVHALHLVAGDSAAPVGFSGVAPPPGGIALMRWDGPVDAPVEQAAATLDVPVRAIYHYDFAERRWLAYVPGSPSFISTYTVVGAGDIVIVRA